MIPLYIVPSQAPSKKSSSAPEAHMATPRQPKNKSDSRWLYDAGFRGLEEFMASYGLDVKRASHVEHAKRLIDGYRKAQQAEWEAQYSSAQQA